MSSGLAHPEQVYQKARTTQQRFLQTAEALANWELDQRIWRIEMTVKRTRKKTTRDSTKTPKRKVKGECLIPPRVPNEVLNLFAFRRNDEEAKHIVDYIERESSKDKEKATFLEKVQTEYILGQKHDCWNVHTDNGQYSFRFVLPKTGDVMAEGASVAVYVGWVGLAKEEGSNQSLPPLTALPALRAWPLS